jgi:hypothetical protein
MTSGERGRDNARAGIRRSALFPISSQHLVVDLPDGARRFIVILFLAINLFAQTTGSR